MTNAIYIVAILNLVLTLKNYFMKRATLLLSFLYCFSYGMLQAQSRYTDLDVAMRGLKNGDTVTINQPVDLKVRVWNFGADTIVSDDTLRLYMTINNNPIMFYDAATMTQSPFSPFGGYNLASDDSDYIMLTNFIFGTGYTAGPLSICMKVIPANAADSVSDTVLTNNESCLNLVLIEEPTTIGNTMFEADINVFPNPAHGKATLRFALNEPADVRVELSDMAGRIVRQDKWSGLSAGGQSLSINTEAIAPGMYIYKLSVGASQHTGRITIE